jgi:hypothetical protein
MEANDVYSNLIFCMQIVFSYVPLTVSYGFTVYSYVPLAYIYGGTFNFSAPQTEVSSTSHGNKNIFKLFTKYSLVKLRICNPL